MLFWRVSFSLWCLGEEREEEKGEREKRGEEVEEGEERGERAGRGSRYIVLGNGGKKDWGKAGGVWPILKRSSF